MTQANPQNYWLSSNALYIELNALGNPDYIQANCVSGAQILVYVKDIIGYDAGHNYQRWSLQAAPTIFTTHTEKYVFAAIPKDNTKPAIVVFPSEIVDIYGNNAAGEHIGVDNYYYINLQGIISGSGENGTTNRTWQSRIQTGYLSSDEALAAGPIDSDWFQYSTVDQITTFIKNLTMKVGTWFIDLYAKALHIVSGGSITFADGSSITGVADDDTSLTSTTHIATPAFIDDNYLSKAHDDETAYKLKMRLLEVVEKLSVDGLAEINGILQHKDFADDMVTGKAWGVYPSGRMQVESLEVRSSLRVLELIYNRLSAQESEFVFTEAGTIESVTPNPDGTYTCAIKKRNDTDFHAFKQGDVIRGVVNNLADLGGGEYFTSWMSIVDIDTTENNTITVSVYADKDVPSGSNTLPAQHMVVQRWGNNIVPSEDAHNNDDYKAFIVPSDKNDGTYINTRQSCWYISSLEKRIVMLDGVNKPKLDNENYSAFFGLPFNFTNNQFKGHTMNPNQPYLYVRGAFLQDIHYIDYLGQIVRQERARGVWSAEIANGDDPYVMNDSTYDTCYYENAKWQCAVELAMFPPSLSNPEWVMLQEFSATTYTLIPSVSQIVRDINGAPTPSVVTVDVIKQVGSGDPTYVTEEECQVYVGINQQMPYPLPSRRIDVPDDAVTLEFYRFNKDSKLGEISFGDSIFSFLTNKVSVSIISKGENGITPTIGTNGNWWINGVDTGLTSKGDDGHTPYIGDDGYWYEWNAETGSYEKTDTYAKGNSVVAQYSADGEHWHYGFVETDLYMRISDDGEVTWSATMKVVGEKGEGGDYIDTSFGISASLTNPSDVDIWADAPMAITFDKPYLWMRQMKKVWDSTTNTYVDSTESAWRNYRYIRVTGEKGETGNGISDVVEEYGVSVNMNTLPIAWTNLETAQNKWGLLLPILWNKETTSYSGGKDDDIRTHIVAVWASDGRSIINIINWYKTSSNKTETAGKESDGWSTNAAILPFDAEHPYLWNYEEIIFDSGSPIMTTPAIKSIFAEGARGKQGVTLRGPSLWNANVDYESGADGEQFQDQVVLSDRPKEMFLCKFSHKGVKPTADTISNENWSAERPWAMTEYREYTASKVLFAERGRIENLDIDNATIRGTITSDTTRIDGSTENKTIIVDAHDMKSLTLASMDMDSSHRMVVLPMLFDYKDDSALFEVKGYAISGTTLKIQTEPCIDVLNWASYELNGWKDYPAQVLELFQKSTLVCADPFTLVAHSENDRNYPDHIWHGANITVQSDTYMHGRFSCRGIMSRFILLPPGQSLTLTSSIQKVGTKECLVWNVENASDFEPINIIMTDKAVTDAYEYSNIFYNTSLGMNPNNGDDTWKDVLLSYKGMDWTVYNADYAESNQMANSIKICINFATTYNGVEGYLPFWQPVFINSSKFSRP